ncbi:uncharacterized protein LOC130690967 [Daphnia carinata]|uniref:uncharacterized protein LOC130690967 n=1 Tax=Daphnia carinata TaxID=120202 RepID=UPI0028691A0D|nr:uncharacterized protein LOC130690967 [Daphnia carinata]
MFSSFSNMEILRASILKTYSAIDVHRVKWNEILKSFESSLQALAGLVDQLECVLRTEPCELSRNFPDLQGKLEQIIRALVEEEMTTMTILLEELNQLNQKIKSICEVTYKVYVDYCDTTQSIPAVYQGTSLYPPISQMIEWIDDINLCYVNKLTNAKYLLEVFDCSPQAVINLQSILNFKNNFSTVDAIMAKMSIFLLEN